MMRQDKVVSRTLLGAGMLAATGLVASCVTAGTSTSRGEWAYYGGGQDSRHYSDVAEITPANVASLREVWHYDMGIGGLQATPLMVDGTLYGLTPDQSVIALDPVTGKKLWQFDPTDTTFQPIRGLTYWRGGADRILFTGNGTKITALDPATGKPRLAFGTNGSVDIREGLDRDPKTLSANLTSPGVVFHDLLIVGFRTGETHPAAPGAIRAYDVHTGAIRWRFDLLPKAGQPGSETWPKSGMDERGGANDWAGLTLDEQRGIVYVPTGSAVDDLYGADRHGKNLYADSLVAIDAATGKYLWHFQAVHHDIWDRDLPSPPVLLQVNRHGRQIDAVAQGTKQGFMFLFDRVTGAPLLPIEERAVPPSDVPGEAAWPTQPFPLLPAPTTRQTLTANDLTTRTPEAAASALRQYLTFSTKGPYTPLAVDKQTLVLPGFDGGMEWGGAAVDPKRGIVYVNSNNVAWTGALQRFDASTEAPGKKIYATNCAGCHGMDRKGSPPEFPSLDNIFARRAELDIVNTIVRGRGRMPAFGHLLMADIGMVLGYLASAGQTERDGGTATAAPRPADPAHPAAAPGYRFSGFHKFQDNEGYPAVAPPWGTLSAIDMNTGKYVWKIPFGEYPELVAAGQKDTGSENYGGPILTRSGLLFIGASVFDRKLRAYDAANGRLLWHGDLPFAGTATPITYTAGGRQYVVIATSGARDTKRNQGTAYVAFALPH
ncbi:pyrroloquinoline quinone-dependent dehydrogenase [Novosphingobium sp.]|uniref:pyrroloquinoline quinone-dependent dehydrogenase n=1 Tax=Novosphingobium sp. TaxID=1874826 RepID=UPI003D1204C3